MRRHMIMVHQTAYRKLPSDLTKLAEPDDNAAEPMKIAAVEICLKQLITKMTKDLHQDMETIQKEYLASWTIQLETQVASMVQDKIAEVLEEIWSENCWLLLFITLKIMYQW